MTWEIKYYKTAGGHETVKEFIDNLQEESQAKLGRQLDLLEQYGHEVGMPHAKTLGGGLMELRVRGKRGSQEVRVFYVFVLRSHIYLLHGFVKKTQATPKKELDIARRRKIEVEEM